MSKFITVLSIDVQALIEMLPKGSNVQSINLTESKRSVELHWENDNLRTPYTVPVSYPLDNLSSGEMPKGVTKKEAPKVTTPEQVATESTETPKSTVDKRRKNRQMLHVT